MTEEEKDSNSEDTIEDWELLRLDIQPTQEEFDQVWENHIVN